MLILTTNEAYTQLGITITKLDFNRNATSNFILSPVVNLICLRTDLGYKKNREINLTNRTRQGYKFNTVNYRYRLQYIEYSYIYLKLEDKKQKQQKQTNKQKNQQQTKLYYIRKISNNKEIQNKTGVSSYKLTKIIVEIKKF